MRNFGKSPNAWESGKFPKFLKISEQIFPNTLAS